MSNKACTAQVDTCDSSSDSLFDNRSDTSIEDISAPTVEYRRRVLTQEGLSLVQREKLHLSGLEWTREILELGYHGIDSIFKNQLESEYILKEVSKNEIPPVLPSTGTKLLKGNG